MVSERKRGKKHDRPGAFAELSNNFDISVDDHSVVIGLQEFLLLGNITRGFTGGDSG